MDVGTDHDIFNHTQLCKHFWILEGAGHAQSYDVLGAFARDLVSIKFNAAFRGFVQSGQKVENSCFPRAIGTDDADDFTLFDMKGHMVNSDQPAKMDRQIFYIK